MKKKMFFALIALVLFFSCTHTNPAASNGNNNSGGGGHDTNLLIASTITRQDTGSTTGQVLYSVILRTVSPNAALLGADVTVSGPGGTFTLNDAYSMGQYSYAFGGTNTPANYYQFNKSYTVTVTENGQTFTQAGNAVGDVTVAADGSSASWLYTGNMNQVNIGGPSSQVQIGPPVSSPVNITGSGVYNQGTGTYTIMVTVIQETIGAFSGSSSGSTFLIEDIQSATVNK